jgi:hypothetical protein
VCAETTGLCADAAVAETTFRMAWRNSDAEFVRDAKAFWRGLDPELPCIASFKPSWIG